MPRVIAMSQHGLFVCLRTAQGLQLVDALGPARRIDLPAADDFAFTANQLWTLRGTALEQTRLSTGRVVLRHDLPRTGRALIAGSQAMVVVTDGAAILVDANGMRDLDVASAFPAGANRLAVVHADHVKLVEGNRCIARVRAPAVTSVHALFGGRLLALHGRDGDRDIWCVVRDDGARVHQIVCPHARRWAVAGEGGAALGLVADTQWQRVELRYGTVSARGELAFPADELELSADGHYLALAQHAPDSPQVIHLPTAEIMAMPMPLAVVPVSVEAPLVVEPAKQDDADDTFATLVPLAFGTPPSPLVAAADPALPPYASAREHLDDMLDVVMARAQGTDVAQTTARMAGRVRSSLAAGVRLPFIELLRELGLPPIAGHILMVAIAPFERGDIARVFQALTGGAPRPLVDRALIEALLAGDDRTRRGAIVDELAPDARLARCGVLAIADGHPFAAITVEPVVLARLRDRIPVPPPGCALAALHLPAAARRALVDALATRRPSPLRLVLRGRRGSGRRTLVAALAQRVGRTAADLDAGQLPRAGTAMAAALAGDLRRTALCGRIPIISGLELADPSDAEGQHRLRDVLAQHAGPLVIRAAPDAALPLAPGFDQVVIDPLCEAERAEVWRQVLDGRGTPEVIDALSARWRLAPGQITDVATQARSIDELDAFARQHVARRLGHVATPVARLATWDEVALGDDIADSVRELIGRAAHRKTVLETWGFDRKLSTSRGLTALFYGPPGTGKTMVAGLVARELGLELYRVDLSKVMSKWIGETEKQLGEIFDAAEDGQVVILFDEADSLFAKRTEVRTSNDRFANLEVNYLLQRLDSFDGIAILTTNLDGSIDPAFKRRLAMRLHFPFPDEELRKRLWAAHVPADAPTARDFNFGELARRFPLSGGYIRNCTLRAAYLAAQEHRPIAHEHFLRAVALEYREIGKLSAEGRLE